jgi:hypothetical protein
MLCWLLMVFMRMASRWLTHSKRDDALQDGCPGACRSTMGGDP